MKLTRRLAAALPAAGVTAVAALALTGAPAVATADQAAARAQHPAVMTTPCSEGQRDEDCGYGDDDATGGGTRGNDGYGGEKPTTSPIPSRTTATPGTTTPTPGVSTTPTGVVNTVPPGGELPATSPAVAASPSRSTGGGVSAGGTLPVTGAPMGLTFGVGALLVAGGAAAVLYSRRRRSA
ncbi:LPXTG cell wall anchor domain-containing protein [Couchioplanes caeruleus]|uniref:LPXTG cell wall anchor domain-containing protein n=1 Tax=Couchioplanes caeruleus TaxID=56438 RepID=UPI00201BA178|nr:LPXTG cell wall anchor domain-containing protein [Couchioplanes caeruleus]UQU66421.1 LPXTG cell wall anchor domain-containing protein [Couchioplanes caeruleus]